MSNRLVATSVTAPWGPIHVAASDRGIVAIDQLVGAEEFQARLERRFGGHPLELADATSNTAATAHLREAVRALGRFLDGDVDALRGLTLDLGDRSDWDKRVLAAVRAIPAGATASYGEVARMIGMTGAARA